MRNILNKFIKSESGVATTEFVVIVAAVIGLGVASVAGLGGDDNAVAIDTDTALDSFVAGF